MRHIVLIGGYKFIRVHNFSRLIPLDTNITVVKDKMRLFYDIVAEKLVTSINLSPKYEFKEGVF